MKILAFDCAGSRCAASVLSGGAILAAESIDSERGHAQLLMSLLIRLSKTAGLGFRDFDRFAVSTGPGSFTGIRVALAAARGLALATGTPAIGITVFDALATAAAETGIGAERLLIAIDSRRAESFFQLFQGDGRSLGDPVMLAPEALPTWAGQGRLAVAGDAADRALAALDPTQTIDTGIRSVDPAYLGRLAANRPATSPPAPFYLRAPDATPKAAKHR